MKLLIVTQRVDSEHPVLGFFHRWIQEFALQYASVTVIAQTVGSYDLPANVRMVSLGKEKAASRIAQVFAFWRMTYAYRREYDAVLVHMTPIWVILGWPFWAAFHTPVYLWYEARGARWPLKIALHLVRTVFSASVHGMPLKTKKSVITGHGIDIDRFRPASRERDLSFLLTVGRVTASKRLPVLIDALAQLPSMHLRIIGGPITPADTQLLVSIRQDIHQKNLEERVEIGSLPNDQIIPLLQRAFVFLHASDTSLDKAVLEAMACGCLVVSSASALKGVLPAECCCSDAEMGQTVRTLIALSPAEQNRLRMQLRAIVERDHSLTRLIALLAQKMNA